MNIKAFLFLIVLSFNTFLVNGQIRHVKGIKSFEGGYGLSKFGNLFYGSFVKYNNSNTYWKVNAFFERGKESDISYNSVGLDFQVNYTIFKTHEFFYLNAAGGLTASTDRLSPALKVFDANGNSQSESYPSLKYGVYCGLEAEMFLTDKFVLILGWNQRLLFGENYGKTRWFSYSGVRYNF